MVIIEYKPKGWTQTQILTFVKEKHGLIGKKMCYVGKLDPMASGLMLFLVEDECKDMDKYMKIDKTYDFELVVGLSTDTHDCLGIVDNFDFDKEFTKDMLDKIVEKYNNFTFIQPYPVYSSYMIKHAGIKQPLWWWAAEGRLDEIKVPEKEVNVYEFEAISGIEKMLYKDYVIKILNDIALIDEQIFRQSDIIDKWNSLLATYGTKEVSIVKFKAYVGSGTYIRGIAHDIGTFIGIPCHAIGINRTKFFY